ncbi:MAG TPA: ABC transporter permease [Candidatus Methylomirabilis sp.]|nr:ABC transporter permease [Candidatus Methylomirabilis sp.]
MLSFYLYPLSRVLWISVTEPQPGLANYALLFTNPAIHRILGTTARICALTTALTLLLGYLVAYAMTHVRDSHRQWMLFCILLTFWLSVLVRAFAWVMLLRHDGPINWALVGLGIVDQPVTLVRNQIGVVIGMVHYMLPYAIFPLYVNMQGIDARLVTAARGLGASPFTAFWRVFLPLNRPGIIGAGMLVFVFSLGFYITPAILGGGRTTMVAEYVGYQIQQTVRWGLATMLASALLLTVFLMIFVLSRIVSLRRLFAAA